MLFKPFQLSDYATLALTNSVLYAGDTGLGKGLLLYVYPLLKCGFTVVNGRICINLPVLITAPGDLFPQIAAEGLEKFNITLIPLDKPTYLKLTANNTRPLPPAFYFASFTDLTRNHVQAIEDHELWPTLTIQQRALVSKGIGEAKWMLAQVNELKSGELMSSNQTTPSQLTNSLTPKITNSFRLRCLSSPTLADLAATAFSCVMIDEGTAMQGGDNTLMARGLLTMDPQYRCVCTATPIKNRLWSIFWLLWWAAGGRQHAHARFPYSADPCQQDTFAADHLVIERNLTREQAAAKQGLRRTHKRRTAEVCNIAHLWKFIAPLVLRRRKENCGEKLVKKTYHYLRVPMSATQSALYRQALEAKSDTIAKIQTLRAIASTGVNELTSYESASIPPSPLTNSLTHKLTNSFTTLSPKTTTTLSLIQQILQRREQFIVFNAFHAATDHLSQILAAAGVKHVTLDGRLTPRKRGLLAQQFKTQSAPGALCGIDSMSLGHSFPLVNNIIISSSTYALDKMLQSVDRAFRLNSIRDLNVYIILCDRSIELHMESDLADKRSASELTLDGELTPQTINPMSPAELLRFAETAFYEPVAEPRQSADPSPVPISAFQPFSFSAFSLIAAAWEPMSTTPPQPPTPASHTHNGSAPSRPAPDETATHPKSPKQSALPQAASKPSQKNPYIPFWKRRLIH